MVLCGNTGLKVVNKLLGHFVCAKRKLRTFLLQNVWTKPVLVQTCQMISGQFPIAGHYFEACKQYLLCYNVQVFLLCRDVGEVARVTYSSPKDALH